MSARSLAMLCLAAGLYAGPSLAQPAMTAGSPDLLKPHLVDIGAGRRLNIECIGQGAPTVVFDQGWGSTILDWAKVQQPVSALTRACFYDRAGMGHSDPAGRPSTPKNITDDLRALLSGAGVRGPVVLVGHSLGGLNVTLYTDRFFDEVAGLVLVDPSFDGQDDLPLTAEQQLAKAASTKQLLDLLAACAAYARQHQLSLSDPHHCFSSKPDFTPAEIAYLLPAHLRPFRWEAMASEYVAGHGAEREFARSFGDKPVIVLVHSESRPAPWESEADHRAAQAQLQRGREWLAARSSRGETITVPHAGHAIQADQPQAVIDAIRKVVLEVRQAH